MKKYCFELYETSDRGLLFKGYKTLLAESTEQARLSAEESLHDNEKLYQIFIES